VAKAFGGLGVTAGLAADRASMTGMSTGQQFYETDTNKLYQYTGSSWLFIPNVDASGYFNVNTNPIVFVGRSSNVSIVGDGTTIPYNNIMSSRNVSAGTGMGQFDTSAGTFKCPVSGLYSISASAYSNVSYEQLWLKINGLRKTTFTISAAYGIRAGADFWYASAGDTIGVGLWAGGVSVSVIASNEHTWLKIALVS